MLKRTFIFATAVMLLTGANGAVFGSDEEVQAALRQVVADDAFDEVERVRQEIAYERQQSTRRIATLRTTLKQMRASGASAADMNRTKRLLADERTLLGRIENDRITAARPSVRKLLTVSRRTFGPAYLSALSFFTTDTIATLEAISNRGTKWGTMYRLALQGNCAGLVARANSPEWVRQLELELLAANVRTASVIVDAFIAKIREGCR